MAKRDKQSQTAHDKRVQELAKDYKSKGYKVRADVSGYPQPDTIGGKRPDIVATKDKERKIVEVETEDSKGSKRDLEQQKAFRQAADRSDKTTFRRVIADQKKK